MRRQRGFLINPYALGIRGPRDPHFANVSLLLHLNGPNGSTSLVDSSANQRGVIANGNAHVDTAQSKFGGASVALDGSGDYLSSPDYVGYTFGSGNFTAEGWCRLAADPAATGVLIGQWTTATNLAWYIAVGTSRRLFVAVSTTGSFQVFNEFASSNNALPVAGTWFHWTIVRDGALVRGHVAGVGVCGGTIASGPAVFDSSTDVTIGCNSNATQPVNGHIDEVRITKGVARYPGGINFTPPANPFEDH